ncbi:MAG: ATP phosphoribosyltransferase regulatory subunit [Spirochaetales bacterium]|nr:ATP phosphoribosyltransferase regulatory subunit [Candidatus Physcosoma equi]
MTENNMELRGEEKVVYALRSLYTSYGYVPYRMSRFEEYDLYAGNKDFLVSGAIITFTDTDGKLMALKPDVTLSIVKSIKDQKGPVSRVCYDENVYRVSDQSGTFREIMQVGLECIGPVDLVQLAEVVVLAEKSLSTISSSSLLALSHMGIVEAFLDSIASEDLKNEVIKCLSARNVPELKALCEENPEDAAAIDKIRQLASLNGSNSEILASLETMGADKASLSELKSILSVLSDEKTRIDFSVIGGMNYYNGIVFRGYVEGVPGSVLSGGQYDKLMARMGRKQRAVGFAVYMDALERLLESKNEYDTDVVLLYEEGDDVKEILSRISEIQKGGESVTAVKTLPTSLRYKRLEKTGGKNA